MDSLIWIILGVVVVFFVVRSVLRSRSNDQNRPSSTTSTPETPKEPRDYLQEATGFVNAPRPLSELVREDRAMVVSNLISALTTGGTMVRKAAVYALGQIGDPRAVEAMKTQLNIEPAPGVKEAIVASISAINIAPVGGEHTELERRQIIEAVYNGKMRPQLNAWR